jgi:hypothetical protein
MSRWSSRLFRRSGLHFDTESRACPDLLTNRAAHFHIKPLVRSERGYGASRFSSIVGTREPNRFGNSAFRCSSGISTRDTPGGRCGTSSWTVMSSIACQTFSKTSSAVCERIERRDERRVQLPRVLESFRRRASALCQLRRGSLSIVTNAASSSGCFFRNFAATQRSCQKRCRKVEAVRRPWRPTRDLRDSGRRSR